MQKLYKNNNGFSLIEILVYVGIIAISAGMLTSILQTTTTTQVNETAENNVSGQLNFAMQKIQNIVKESSYIDMTPGDSSSTLKLKMHDSDTDNTDLYTIIYLENGKIYYKEASGDAKAITSDTVTVNSLSFTKFTEYPSHDTVQIDMAITGTDSVKNQTVTRSLRSAISRASAVTFDSSVIPGVTNTSDIGSSDTNWKDGYFSGSVYTNSLCISGNCKTSWGDITGTSGSGTANYISKWTSSSALGDSVIYDDGTSVGIGTTSPGEKLEIANGNILLGNAQKILFKDTSGTGRSAVKLTTNDLLVFGNNSSGDIIFNVGTLGEAIRFKQTTGYVGIGTSTPSEKLDVNGNVKAISYYGDGSHLTGITSGQWTDAGTYIYANNSSSTVVTDSGEVGIGTTSTDSNYKLTTSNGGIKSESGSTPAGYFNSTSGYGLLVDNGNVGIGTSTPSEKLDVNGNVKAISYYGDGSHLTGITSGQWTDAGTYIYANNSNSTVVTDTGKVGIGTTSPSSQLTINGDSADSGGRENQLFINGGTSNYDKLYMGIDTTNHYASIEYVQELTKWGPLVLQEDGGKVGIGTTTPAYTLDVNGTGYFSGNVSLADNITVDGYDLSDYGPYWISSAGTSGQVWTSDGSGQGIWSSASTSGQWTDAGTYIYANNSSSTVVTDTGKVGIGKIAPSYTLDVDGNGYFNTSSTYGIYAESTSGGGSGVYGRDIATGGVGVYGQAANVSGYGIYGYNSNGSGIYGKTIANGYSGVYGENTSISGGYGVYGYTNNTAGYGVYGYNPSGAGIYGKTGANGYSGVYGEGPFGIYGNNSTTGGFGVYGVSTDSSGYGVYGSGGFIGLSGHTSSTAGIAVNAYNSGTTGDAIGLKSISDSSSGYGVWGEGKTGIYGRSTLSGGYGVYGAQYTGSYAGYFSGDVHITGELTKGSGSFVQPHPTDPTKELVYSFFEGRDNKVFFDGTAELKNGIAIIDVPEDFQLVVSKEKPLVVTATPNNVPVLLYVSEKSYKKIVIKSDKKIDANIDYFVTGFRGGFENSYPIQDNQHFKPRSMNNKDLDTFKNTFEGNNDDKYYSKETKDLTKELLISNGTLNNDGTLNLNTVGKIVK